VTQRS
jgi:8-oxo-dGTP pyrophosphatase MutT (NUDIX family)